MADPDATSNRVYVARWIDYEDSGIIGVYSTPEKARAAAEAEVGDYSYDAEVAEFTVDGERGREWYKVYRGEWR